ncbi:hypothetical protein D3C71_1884440 [compost metagenome]
MAYQGVNGTAYQAFDDEAVEAANHQSIATFGGDEGTFDGLQGHSDVLIFKSEAACKRPRQGCGLE